MIITFDDTPVVPEDVAYLVTFLTLDEAPLLAIESVGNADIDDHATMDDLPLVQGLRMGRYALTGGGYPFGYHHGCGHGRTPRTKA